LKILFLGPEKTMQNSSIEFLLSEGNSVNRFENKLNTEAIYDSEYDFLISFGYRYIINKEIIDYFKGMAINLHISYLPWNKGADPNLWSILENTTKGVTIHQLDYGLDMGKILCQREIYFDENETLRTSYDKLQSALVKLFRLNWLSIKYKKIIPTKQNGAGSYHKSVDKKSYLELLNRGWDTKIIDLKGKALNV
jgi:methionyl-tRNA formyltransferase